MSQSGMLLATKQQRLVQVSAVINLHHSKLPPIPSEGSWRNLRWKKKEKEDESWGQRKRKSSRNCNAGEKIQEVQAEE